MSTTTATKEHFGPTKPTPKRIVSGLLSGLFAGARSLDDEVQKERLATFNETIAKIVEVDLAGKGKLPTESDIRDVCAAAGRSIGDLERGVEHLKKVRQLQSDLAAEQSANDDLAAVQKAIEQHNEDTAATIAAMQVKGTQLVQQLRAAEEAARNYDDIKRRLTALVTQPSERELQIVEQIKASMKAEADLRSQAGRFPLAETFINSKQEETSDHRELTALDEQITELEAETGDGLSSAEHKLRKLYPRRDELQRKVASDRRLYELGVRVAEHREEQKRLSDERDQLAKDRLAAIEI